MTATPTRPEMGNPEMRGPHLKPFAERYDNALHDPNIQSGLLDFQRSWRVTRDEQMASLKEITGFSFEDLRGKLTQAKNNVIAAPDEHVARFKANIEARGGKVVLVGSADEANAYIAHLCHERGIALAVKGKSMVSEEIGLNEALAHSGVEAVETDLGEWLLQLGEDRPSHLVMPAIHKRRHQVAELFTRVLGRPFDPDDIPAMVLAARHELRAKFLAAGIGITGANGLIAETGTIMLVTNEGNGRLTSSLPRVHVVTTGVEKVLPTAADAITQIRILARSATAQPITTYTTFISAPAPGHELHVVLIDNGRRLMSVQPGLEDALRCIRCGACANVCPAYQVVGGHAFGHVYTGPIGLVTTAFHHGLDAAAGPQSLCVSCGACATVCPVTIPLPQQILEVRRLVAERAPSTAGWRRVAMKLAMRAYASRTLFALGTRVAGMLSAPLRDASGKFTRLPAVIAEMPAARRYLAWRTPPAVAPVPARALAKQAAAPPMIPGSPLAGRRIAFFLQCIGDRVAPEIPLAAIEVLRAAGADVRIPESQHCCGLPAFDGGDRDNAIRMAKATIAALEGNDDIVTPALSCVVAMLHEYETLFAGQPGWQQRARVMKERVYDLVGYLAGPGRLPDGALAGGSADAVAVHRFCQGSNMLNAGDRLERLLRDVAGVEAVPLFEAEVCCGFGGSTSVRAPEISQGILARKLANVLDTAAPILVTDNPGCVLHLRGGADAASAPVRVMHVAEYLASRLPGRS
ncbi:MAG: LUD domain-containing protein [Chloroflexota bacterium]